MKYNTFSRKNRKTKRTKRGKRTTSKQRRYVGGTKYYRVITPLEKLVNRLPRQDVLFSDSPIEIALKEENPNNNQTRIKEIAAPYLYKGYSKYNVARAINSFIEENHFVNELPKPKGIFESIRKFRESDESKLKSYMEMVSKRFDEYMNAYLIY